MTPEQVELAKTAARSVIAEHEAGRPVDEHRLEWAQQFLRANPRPLVVLADEERDAYLDSALAAVKAAEALLSDVQTRKST